MAAIGQAPGRRGKTKIFSGLTHEAALILYNSDWSDRKIAAAFSTTASTVRDWRKEHRIEALQLHKRHRKLDHDRALELYRSGANDHEIARLFGMHYTSVREWRVKQHLPPHMAMSPKMTDVQRRKVRSLLGERASLWQVARALNRRSIQAIIDVKKTMKGDPRLRRSGQKVSDDRKRAFSLDQRELLKRIRQAVGSRVAADIAADAVNDLYLAVVEGTVQPNQIETEAPRYVSRNLTKFASSFGALSIDDRDEDGLCLGDMLIDEEALAEIEAAGEAAFAN